MEHPLTKTTMTMSQNYPLLSKLSWQEIQHLYGQLGLQLKEYERIKRCIHLQWLDRGFNSLALDAWWFDQRFKADVQLIDTRLSVLDREINRRNNLIGVMG